MRFDREGNLEIYATEGLSGPIGLTFDGSGNLCVCNCSGNYVARVDANGNTTRFAESPDFDCFGRI